MVAGHQRLKDLKKRGFKGTHLLEAVVVDLDESDEKALNIALNSPALMGEFDGRLADLLAELQSTREDDLFERLHLDDLLEDAEKARKEHVSFDANPAGTHEVGDFEFSVILRCKDEAHQVELLERFAKEGFQVKALTL